MATPAQTPTKTRRDTISAALDKSLRPKPLGGPPLPRGMTPMQLAGEIVRREREPAVGGMTKLLHRLPPGDRAKVLEVANLYHEHKEFGDHGHPEHVLDSFAVPKDVADAVLNGLEVDYVAAELQSRRGSDADRPLPEITRRDQIEAAMDAHVPNLNDHA